MAKKSGDALGVMLKGIEQRAKARKEHLELSDTIVKENLPEVSAEDVAEELNPIVKGKGYASAKLKESASQKLDSMEQLGLFSSYPVNPGDEFPTLLTRLPIFLPGKRTKQKAVIDNDLAYPFETPFGKGRRFGAPLTTSDEDVLYALMRLRQKKLRGIPSRLPIRIANNFKLDDEGRVDVHTTICAISDVHRELGVSGGGKNYEDTLDSIKRLNSTTIELELTKHDRYLGKMRDGGTIELLKVRWKAFDEYQLLYVQFDPIICDWLENEFTYLNWDQRKSISSDIGKTLHRFLSSQPKVYDRDLLSLAKIVCPLLPKNKIKSTLDKLLRELVDVGFLKDHKITGTGRAKPHHLYTWR